MIKELIEHYIEKIQKGQLDERVISYNDFKSKYTVLKNSVIVEIALTNGKVAKIDITDYFKEVLK